MLGVERGIMRIFATSAVEIAVLGVAVLLLMIWTNHLTQHLRASLRQLAEQVEPEIREAAQESAPTMESSLQRMR